MHTGAYADIHEQRRIVGFQAEMARSNVAPQVVQFQQSITYANLASALGSDLCFSHAAKSWHRCKVTLVREYFGTNSSDKTCSCHP